MFKKIIIFVLFFSLVFFTISEDFFIKEKLDYSSFVFSEEVPDLSTDYLNILLIQGEEDFVVHNRNDFKGAFFEEDLSSLRTSNTTPVIINNSKEDLENFLDGLDCEKHIVLTQYDFLEHNFFNEQIVLKEEPLNLYGAYYFAKKCGKEKFEFLDSSLYFKEEGKEASSKILFVGDMMFDRGVNLLMKNKNDYNYPFEKIGDYLKNVDTLVGNLEGPIVQNMTFISDHSMSFNFDKRMAKVLKDNNFQILSLANNHTTNRGYSGLKETRNFLKENDIDYVGEPDGCSINDVLVKDDIIYYAINKTFPFNCSSEEIVENIKKLEKEKFLIVLIHWGDEYVHNASSFQTNLAHKMIDAGADLIIGGHAHVVQNIEKYKNKLIFYSLGNFIFDQYFSKETQQGLMVSLEFKENKQVYHIFLTESEKAQPKFIKDSSEFLEWLAGISSDDLKEEIKKGEITIYQQDQ
ncbi:MAG: CapA family protein [Candidatus Paceibacterota bacterium]